MFAVAFKSDSTLLRLFDTLEEQPGYNAATIKKKTGIANLPEAKNGLRRLIFKAMRNYHEEDGHKEQLRRVFNDVDFLLKKGLDEEAKKEINKGWKIAEKFEAYGDMAEMLDRLSNINLHTLQHTAQWDGFEHLLEQMDSLSVKQQQVYGILLYNRYISYLISTNQYYPAKADGIDLQKIIVELNAKMDNIKSPYEQCVLLFTIATCYQTAVDAGKARNAYERLRALFKKHPSLIDTHPTAYLGCIFNYAMISTLHDTPEFSQSLIKEAEQGFLLLKEFFRTSPHKLVYYRERLTVIKLNYAKTGKQWHMLGKLEAEVKHHIAESDIKQRVITALQAAGLISCFYEAKKYDKAIDWVNQYYQLDDAKILKPLMTCVRVMEALIYNAKGQFDISDNRCTNLYKTLVEQKLPGDYYKYLSILLRKLNHWDTNNPVHRKEIETLKKSFVNLDATGADTEGHAEFYQPVEILENLLNR